MVPKTHTLVNKTTTLTTAHWRLHNTICRLVEQAFSLVMPELLCEQITQICFRVFLGDTASTRRKSLTVPVVSNRMMLLLQRGRGIGTILRHGLVVTENIRCTVDWYAKHTEIIP